MARGGWVRWLWLGLGHAALILGIIGAFLPLLPTTPFLIFAAACYSRGSVRLEAWLLSHPRLGPPLQAWRRSGAIAPRVKIVAVGCIIVSGAYTLSLPHIPRFGKIGLIAVLASVVVFICTRPNHPRPPSL